jgi:hypothetical protein
MRSAESPSTKHQISNKSECSKPQSTKGAAATGAKKWFSDGRLEHSDFERLFDAWCLGFGVSSKPGKLFLGEPSAGRNRSMDGRAKKRLEVIKQKLQLLRQKLSGARRQDDEPGEVRKLEQEIAALEAEMAKLKA